MKNILFIALILFSIQLIAQTESSGKQYSGGVYFAPNISYRLLSNTDEYYDWLKDRRDLYERPAFYFSAGIKLNLDIDNKYGFESGISYLQNGYAYKKTELLNNSLYTNWSNNVRYSLLEIPLGFRYYISKQKLKLFASVGLGVAIPLSSSVVYHYFIDNKLERNEIYRNILETNTVILNSYLGLGVKYPLSESIDLTTRLMLSQNISSVLDSDIGEYLSSGCLSLGISKNF